MTPEIRAELRHLRRRVAGVLRRAVVTGIDAGKKLAAAQVSGIGGTSDDVEVAEPLGLTSRARAGAEALLAQLGGIADNAVVIGWFDRRDRPTDLEAGETVVYDAHAHRLELREDGARVVAPDSVELGVAHGVTLTPADGIVTGQGIDPYTGLSYFALGNASSICKAAR